MSPFIQAAATRHRRPGGGGAPPPVYKPLIIGIGPRTYGSYGGRSHCGYIVAMTYWNDWQSNAFGAINTSGAHITEINNALAAVRAFQDTPGDGLTRPMPIRIRIMTGVYSPDDVKKLGGPYAPGDARNQLIICDSTSPVANPRSPPHTPSPYSGQSFSMGRYWLTTSPFSGLFSDTYMAAFEDFMSKVAAFSHSSWGGYTVETHPQILEIAVHPASTIYAEPYQRGSGTGYVIDNTSSAVTTVAVASTAGATSLTVTSVTPLALSGADLVGRSIRIGTGATKDVRTVTAVAGNVLTVAAMTFAHGIGESVVSTDFEFDFGISGQYDGMTNIEAYVAAGLEGCPGGLAANGPDPDERAAMMRMFDLVGGVPRWRTWFPTTRLYLPHNPLQHWKKNASTGAVTVATDPNGCTAGMISDEAAAAGKQVIMANNSWRVKPLSGYLQMYQDLMDETACAFCVQTATTTGMSDAEHANTSPIDHSGDTLSQVFIESFGVLLGTIYKPGNDPSGWITSPPNTKFRGCAAELPTGWGGAITDAQLDAWYNLCLANAAPYV